MFWGLIQGKNWQGGDFPLLPSLILNRVNKRLPQMVQAKALFYFLIKKIFKEVIFAWQLLTETIFSLSPLAIINTYIVSTRNELFCKTEMEKDGTKTKSKCKENAKNKNIDKEKD